MGHIGQAGIGFPPYMYARKRATVHFLPHSTAPVQRRTPDAPPRAATRRRTVRW